ncbi:MAG: SEC-C domain-containing protein, partial [Deltaproteobacteria bacterium]
MLHAFKLGPLEFPEGDQFVYAALGDRGPLQPVFAPDDAKGLQDLVAGARREPVRCEPGLASAARSLGLPSGRLPPDALRFRASMAMALALGPEASAIGAQEMEGLILAFARFWRVRPWERFDSDDAVRVVLTRGGRPVPHEASVLGGGGDEFGVALYPKAGSVARMVRLVEEDRVDDVQRIESISAILHREPPFAVQAMEEAHGLPGFPAPLSVGRGTMDLADRTAVIALTAALDAFASVMPDRRQANGVAGQGPDRCEVSVTVSEPGAASATRDEEESIRARLRTSRNAPCPCGSGRKYKKCHLGEDEERLNGPSRAEARRLAERNAIHGLDDRLNDRMLRLAERRWGGKFDVVEALEAIGISEGEADFFLPWAVHHFPGPEGFPPRELLLREEGARLRPEERAWLEAQAAAMVSVWEVKEVVPGQGITLRNLLGEEERSVHEVAGSRVLKPRDTLLGRVVDHGEATFLCGIHP